MLKLLNGGKRIPTGAWVNENIYLELKALAVREKITMGEMLDKTMLLYLAKIRAEQNGEEE